MQLVIQIQYTWRPKPGRAGDAQLHGEEAPEGVVCVPALLHRHHGPIIGGGRTPDPKLPPPCVHGPADVQHGACVFVGYMSVVINKRISNATACSLVSFDMKKGGAFI